MWRFFHVIISISNHSGLRLLASFRPISSLVRMPFSNSDRWHRRNFFPVQWRMGWDPPGLGPTPASELTKDSRQFWILGPERCFFLANGNHQIQKSQGFFEKPNTYKSCSPIIRVTWMLVETFQFFGMDFVKPGFRQRWSLFFIAISQKFQLRRMKFLSFGRPWKLSATFCRIPVQLEVPENSSKNPS